MWWSMVAVESWSRNQGTTLKFKENETENCAKRKKQEHTWASELSQRQDYYSMSYLLPLTAIYLPARG